MTLESIPEILDALQVMFTLQGDRIVCNCIFSVFSQANQYGGSGAMHKEIITDSDEKHLATAAPIKKEATTGFTINALTSIQRYF